jgi:hypothetical protein
MIFLSGFIIIVVKVSSILIGCVPPALANRRRCRPGRGGVGKIGGPAGVSAVLEWQRGGGGRSRIFLSPRGFSSSRCSKHHFVCLLNFKTNFTIFETSLYMRIIVPHHEFRNIFLCENYYVCSHNDIQIFLWLRKNYNIYSNTIYVSYTYY